MGLIGRGWKPCEGWSRPVLIGRGLAHNIFCCSHPLCDPEHTTSSAWHPGWGGGWGGVFVAFALGFWGGGCCGIVLSVVVAEWGTPGPIPNPEAKPSSADGTALVRVWESRSSPTFNVVCLSPAGSPAGLNSFPGLFRCRPISCPNINRSDHGRRQQAPPCVRPRRFS